MALEHLVASLLLLPATGLALHAADIVWTNTNGGSWNTAANWEPNRVPGPDDTVLLTRPGTYTVSLNVDAAIRDLTLGADSGTQTLATAGRTLAMNGHGSVGGKGQFVLSGGSLSGTGRLDLEGLMTWQYGSVDTNAAVVVHENGRLTLASSGNHAKLLYGGVTNAGVVTWKPYGAFGVGGTFHNLPGGVFDIQEDNISITRATDGAVIRNDGLIQKTVDGAITCYVPLDNQGTVDTRLGTLSFQGGGRLRSGNTFTGAGVTRLVSGTNILEGDCHSANLVLAGADLAGDGRVDGTLVWESGSLLSGASLTVLPGATLRLSSSGNYVKLILGNLTNAGTLAWQNYGNVQLGGVLHNLPGGVFEVQVDNRSMAPVSPDAILLNEGLLRKAAGPLSVGCSVPTLNRGALEITSGTLTFGAGCTNESGTILIGGATLEATEGLELTGGRLAGWGTVSGNVLNRAATVSPDPTNGGLKIKGRYTQELLGTIELNLAGNRPGIDQSRLDITREARLGGTLDILLAPGYLPAPDTAFEMLTGLSRTGEFDASNGSFLLGSNLRLEAVYAPDRVQLVAVTAPDPDTVPLVVASQDATVLVSWPTEFPEGTLYRKNAVGEMEWTPLPGVRHRLIESPPAPERYFRLGPP